jgi:imidazolonepropionase
VPLVVATDANPGSSPTVQPLVALNQACVLFGLTPAEAIAGMTRLAAGVLGLEDRGVLEVGRRADLACWNIGEPAELAYWVGGLPAQAVISGGRRIR